MRLIKLAAPSEQGWDDAWRIYEAAFPRKERRSLADTVRALEDDRFEFMAIIHRERVVGIVALWHLIPSEIYIEFLAVDSKMRGRGIGQWTLAQLREQAESIVLEVEPPIDELTERRVEFYRREMFTLSDFSFTHPSYQEPFEPHELRFMSYPEPLTAEHYASIKEVILDDLVARYSEHC